MVSKSTGDSYVDYVMDFLSSFFVLRIYHSAK